MKLEMHKVTWYSKALAMAIFIGAPFLAFYFGVQFQKLRDAAALRVLPSAPAAAAPGDVIPSGVVQPAPPVAAAPLLLATSTYAYPYPLTWTYGPTMTFSVVGASLEKGTEKNTLTFLMREQFGKEGICVDGGFLRRVVNEQGEMEQPASFSIPTACGPPYVTKYGTISFLVPSGEREFVFLIINGAEMYFTASINPNGTITITRADAVSG